MKVVKYQEQYKKAVQDICVATSSRASIDPLHKIFTLNMYCNEYLEHELVYVLKHHQDIVGYILCARNYQEYFKHMKPYIEIINELGTSYQQRVENELKIFEKYQEDYPAHLHIDIKESFTGEGNGSKLMSTLLETLKKEQIKGIMLGVSKHNTRAIQFYKKFNFIIIEETTYAYLMGVSL